MLARLNVVLRRSAHFLIAVSLSVAMFPILGISPASAVPIAAGDFLPGATVVDFETGSSSLLPVVPGVSFPDTTAPLFRGNSLFGSPALFGAQSYTNFSISETFSDLAIVLDTSAQAMGAWVGQNVGSSTSIATSITVSVFDESSNLLEQIAVVLPARGQPGLFVGFASSAGIARMEWRGSNTGFFSVDNITFGPIPEPSSALMIGLGLAALGARRRA